MFYKLLIERTKASWTLKEGKKNARNKNVYLALKMHSFLMLLRVAGILYCIAINNGTTITAPAHFLQSRERSKSKYGGFFLPHTSYIYAYRILFSFFFICRWALIIIFRFYFSFPFCRLFSTISHRVFCYVFRIFLFSSCCCAVNCSCFQFWYWYWKMLMAMVLELSRTSRCLLHVNYYYYDCCRFGSSCALLWNNAVFRSTTKSICLSWRNKSKRFLCSFDPMKI